LVTVINRLRLACAALAGWLFLLFNVERFHAPLNVGSFVYVIAAVTAVVIVGIKPLAPLPFRWLVAAPVAVLLLLKSYWGYPLVGQALPITVVEICALSVTVALAHQIAVRLNIIDKASAGMIADEPGRQPVSLETAQSAMYREVRRARQHDRPLAVLAVASTGQSVNATQERLLRELERELLDKYTNARIADLLAKETSDHGIVTHCNRHFLVLLPETDRAAAEDIVRQLNASVKTALGLKLRVGVSTFPDEEVTLVGLLQRAEAAMRDRGSIERRPLETTRELSAASTHASTHDGANTAPGNRDTAVDMAANRETVSEVEEIKTTDTAVRDPQEAGTPPASRSVRLPA
jgi:hypothetical protein